MVYLLEEYLGEHPYRAHSAGVLRKFIDCPKYLHEMSIEEINAEVSSWNKCTQQTVKMRKSVIMLYLDWLKEKELDVDVSIVDKIVFPILNSVFLIYSTEDIHNLWSELILDLEAPKYGKSSSDTEHLLVCYVGGLLAWYGLTNNQIFDLNLNDVTEDGICGYDLPLTKKDVEILMKYKNLKKIANKPLLGTTYIRTTAKVRGERILSNGLSKLKYPDDLSEELSRLPFLLTPCSLYKLGKLNRIFVKDKASGFGIERSKSVPDWFKEMASDEFHDYRKKSCDGTIRKFRENYMSYLTERKSYYNIVNDSIKGLRTRNEVLKDVIDILKANTKSTPHNELLCSINTAIAKLESIID